MLGAKASSGDRAPTTSVVLRPLILLFIRTLEGSIRLDPTPPLLRYNLARAWEVRERERERERESLTRSGRRPHAAAAPLQPRTCLGGA
jgi:hypothetical protein